MAPPDESRTVPLIVDEPVAVAPRLLEQLGDPTQVVGDLE